MSASSCSRSTAEACGSPGQARVLLGHASVVQEQLELARADLAAWQDGVIGEVRVAGLSTAISAVVAPAIAQLRGSRPSLDVRVSEDEAPRLFSRLDAGDVDIAIAADYRDAPSRHDPRYHRVDLITDVMDVVVPQGHPLADPNGVRLSDFAAEPWVGTGEENPCAQIFLAVCAVAGFSPDLRHHCTEWDAVAALVAAGAGVALIPRLAQPLRHGRPRRLPGHRHHGLAADLRRRPGGSPERLLDGSGAGHPAGRRRRPPRRRLSPDHGR